MRIDRELASLSIRLPSPGSGDNILSISPDICFWRFENPETEKSEQVFPACEHGEYYKLVHYIILMFWFGSPLRMVRNLAEKKKQALLHCGINYDELPELTPKGRQVICKFDVDLNPEHKGKLYMDNFILFQRHYPYAMFMRSLILLEKQEKFYQDINLDTWSVPEKEKLLAGMRDFLTMKISLTERLYEFHKTFLATQFTVDDLLDQLEKKLDASPIVEAKKPERKQYSEEGPA